MNVAEISFLLKKINKQIMHISRQEFKQFGITMPQALVLKEISHEPKMISQISEAVDLSKSTVSGIVDRLEKNGWVTRQRDLNDRRAVWIYKTDKINEVTKRNFTLQEEIFEGVPQAEIDTVIRTLQLILKHLEERDGGIR